MPRTGMARVDGSQCRHTASFMRPIGPFRFMVSKKKACNSKPAFLCEISVKHQCAMPCCLKGITAGA